jgi:hypothetical protein
LIKLDFDEEAVESVANKIAEMAFQKLKVMIDSNSKWPPLLSKSDLMEFAGIKAGKASELLNRPDFPVIRDFGHPRVPLHLLMKWIEEHTDWMEENAPNYDSWAM